MKVIGLKKWKKTRSNSNNMEIQNAHEQNQHDLYILSFHDKHMVRTPKKGAIHWMNKY
jgi:hypothetical protein